MAAAALALWALRATADGAPLVARRRRSWRARGRGQPRGARLGATARRRDPRHVPGRRAGRRRGRRGAGRRRRASSTAAARSTTASIRASASSSRSCARAASRALDLVALSHPHPDHLNGLRRILRRFPVGALWTSGDDGTEPGVRAPARARARARRARARADGGRAGPRAVEPLGPFLGDARRRHRRGSRSTTPRWCCASTSRGGRVLFPGDLEADGEGELVGRRALGQRGRAPTCSRSRTTAAGPRPATSCSTRSSPASPSCRSGWRNRFHFPAPEVVAALRRARRRGAAHRSRRRRHGDDRSRGRGRRQLRAGLPDVATPASEEGP